MANDVGKFTSKPAMTVRRPPARKSQDGDGQDGPWLKSLRSKRAFDALKAGVLVPKRSLHPSNGSAERGITYAKAPQLEIEHDSTGEGALISSVENCLTHLSSNEACAIVGAEPEGVHQMRVALRRFDALLSLYKPMIPKAQSERLLRCTKGIAHSLAPARDWDVFIAEILDPVLARSPNDADLKLLSAEVTRRRAAAYRDVTRVLRSRAYADMWREVAGWLAEREWRQQPISENAICLVGHARPFGEFVLDRTHRKILKRGRGFAVLSNRERHKLRIRVKKLRYAAEFFSPLFVNRETSGYVSTLKSLQDALGHINDVEVAQGLLEGLSSDNAAKAQRLARAGGLVIGWHRHAIGENEKNLVRAWRKFKRMSPFWR